MRILNLFNRYLEVGGEELFVRGLKERLEPDHEVSELSFDSADWRAEGMIGKLTQPLRMFRNPKSLKRLDEALDEHRPDVALVHNLFPVGSLACYRWLRSRGVPVVQYIHNFRPFSVNGYCWADGRLEPAGLERNFLPEIWHGAWQGSRLKTACYAAVIQTGHLTGIWKNVSGWVAISDFMRDRFVEAGMDPERVTTIRHGWERVRTGPVPPPPTESRSLVFLGRLSEEKGLRVLVDAWEKVEAEREDGELIIGGGGPLEGWIRRRTEKLKRIRLAGFVKGEEKLQLIESARAMVVPSVWWEALGLVVYEAYDASRPVLAAASGGLTETVIPGETGWLHEPGDVARLAEQMHEVLDGDGGEAARRGAEGRRWLERNTGMDEWRQAFDRVLERAVRVG